MAYASKTGDESLYTKAITKGIPEERMEAIATSVTSTIKFNLFMRLLSIFQLTAVSEADEARAKEEVKKAERTDYRKDPQRHTSSTEGWCT